MFHYYFFSYINVYLKFFSITLGFRASLQSVLKMTKITIQSIFKTKRHIIITNTNYFLAYYFESLCEIS